MSKQWHHPAHNDRTISNRKFAYTDRHPSDRKRIQPWHAAVAIAFIGLVCWGLA